MPYDMAGRVLEHYTKYVDLRKVRYTRGGVGHGMVKRYSR